MTRKRLVLDARGEERLLPTFVMVASFFAAILVLTMMMRPLMIQASGAYEQKTNTEMIGGLDYDLIAPTSGYNIIHANVTSDPFDDNANKKLQFYPTGWSYLTVRIVRDREDLGTWDAIKKKLTGADKYKVALKYTDFILVHGKVGSKDKWYAISLDELKRTSNKIGENISAVSFNMLKLNITVIVQTASDAANHSALIDADLYNLRVAASGDLMASLGQGTMWTLLWQMMTMQLPSCDPVTSVLLAVPFWAAVFFMFAMVVSRFIPLIAGG